MAPRKAQDKGKVLRGKFESVEQKGRQKKAQAIQDRRALIGEKRRRKTDR